MAEAIRAAGATDEREGDPLKIVRTNFELQMPIVDRTLREAGHDLRLLPDGISEQGLIEAVRDIDLILMCYTPVTRAVIEAAPNLKGIVKYGVGIDAIDIPTAIERGVPVVNIPLYAEETVAEGAFALMIALAKKLIPLDRQMRDTGWAWPEPTWLAADIADKTVGIIGAGRIGRSFARMAGAGFRARVVGYDPYVPPDEMRRCGIEPVGDIGTLLKQSDFVSLHCVLTAETRHIIGEAELQAMKPGAYLINTSRGALVDERALIRALAEDWIAGAGLDVFSQEPVTRDGHPLSLLYDMPNVLLSPHLTFYTAEAMERLERETLERCFEVLEGRDVQIRSQDPRLRAQVRGVKFVD